MPGQAIGCGFHEAVRGVLSHHVVIRDGKIANYHPYPPTPWNASPRDVYGTPGPYEDAVQNTPIFEENGPDKFKGIDIMRAVRSFDPCLPCGVHMYLRRRQTARRPAHADVRCAGLVSPTSWQLVPRNAGSLLLRRRRDKRMTNTLNVNEFQGRLQNLEAPPPRRGSRSRPSGPDPSATDRPGDTRITCGWSGTTAGTHCERRSHRGPDCGCLRGDDIVGGMLLLHGLHPLEVETRVRKARESVRPYLRSHGGNVELIEVANGIAHLRLDGSCHSCPSSSVTMQQTVEEAIYAKTPEVVAVEVEGLTTPPFSENGDASRFTLPIV